jgi:hypothetical protein
LGRLSRRSLVKCKVFPAARRALGIFMTTSSTSHISAPCPAMRMPQRDSPSRSTLSQACRCVKKVHSAMSDRRAGLADHCHNIKDISA